MAQAFAEAGAELVLVGREAEALAEDLTSCRPGPADGCVAGDLGRRRRPRSCAEIWPDGPIDILINNVGGRREHPTEDLPLETGKHTST